MLHATQARHATVGHEVRTQKHSKKRARNKTTCKVTTVTRTKTLFRKTWRTASFFSWCEACPAPMASLFCRKSSSDLDGREQTVTHVTPWYQDAQKALKMEEDVLPQHYNINMFRFRSPYSPCSTGVHRPRFATLHLSTKVLAASKSFLACATASAETGKATETTETTETVKLL